MSLIIVTGQPRSGTSLMMRMLAESGIPVVADENRSYETRLTNGLPGNSEWIFQVPDGAAVKVLYPQVLSLPAGPSYRFLWMARNPREQAKSQRKFTGFPRQWIAPRVKYIKKVEAAAPRFLSKFGDQDVLKVSFDYVVETGDISEVNRWLGRPLNVASLKIRDPKCSGLPVGVLETSVGASI